MRLSRDIAYETVKSWHEAHEEAVAGWETDARCPGCAAGTGNDEVTDAVMAALTSGVELAFDPKGEPVYGLAVDDVVPEVVEALANEVCDFWHSCADDLAGIGPGQIGYDFNLTRNRHGAGFWDRGLGDAGDRLTDMCRPFGEWVLYLGDDDKLHA